MFVTNHLENWVSNFTVFTFFFFDKKKTPDLGKNEGENSIFIHSYL